MTELYHITRLGPKGDGMANGPVFAPLTLPGEVVTGTRNGDDLTDIRIKTPSGDRVTPPCPYYKRCGGCQVQHASDDFVAQWKTDIIAHALRAHGISAPFRPIVTSPPYSRRRASLAGRRTKKGALVGFHARKSDAIIPITTCHVLDPALMACLPVLQSLTKCAASRSATVRFAITKTDTGLDCNVTGAKPLDKVMRMTLADYRTHFARLSWDGETIFTDTPPRIMMGAARTHIPPGAFLQATPQGEQALLDAVTETIDPAASIIDLFAGCGTFSLPLAQKAAIHAVEGQDDLCAALDHAARHTSGLRHVTIERRDLFRRPIDAETLAQFDAAVIDPPRAGAQAQTHELAKAQIPRIAMVSCNPITFARDAAILIQAGYHIDWIQPVDQFRWSSHVEIAAQLHLPHKT